MTAHDWPRIRAWAADTGIDCPRTGKVPARVVDAYYELHPRPADEAPVEEPAAEEGDEFTVGVTITGSAEAALEIEQHLVNAIYAAFEAGRTHERGIMLAALGGTS